MSLSDVTLEDRLSTALRAPLTSAQRARLDERLDQGLARWRPRPRRFPLRRSLLLAAALLVAVPTVLVAAGVFSTEDPYGLADAREFGAELEAAKAAVVLPDGRAWPEFLQVTDQSASYSRGGARSWVELVSVCIWFDEWLDARAANEPSREAAAAHVIAAIPTWPSWRSPFWTRSVREGLQPEIDAVAVGDPAPIEHEMATNCSWLAGR